MHRNPVELGRRMARGLDNSIRHRIHLGCETRDTPESQAQTSRLPVKQGQITRMMWAPNERSRVGAGLIEADRAEVDFKLIEKPIETENIEIRNNTART